MLCVQHFSSVTVLENLQHPPSNKQPQASRQSRKKSTETIDHAWHQVLPHHCQWYAHGPSTASQQSLFNRYIAMQHCFTLVNRPTTR
ncbi:hypothetical protein Pmani_030689 [Petrolisthes manimaculis]|uniref:Uncharacterized protein n=1 Tax=Petrolisthes manimaculis TaxID=1843537 RepID=A0AAE1TSN5_9EUCA|nr:hypothetical protein Pmani_030689 [Petrolisthes manimaculis]